MNLYTGRTALHTARKIIRQHWEDTHEVWTDQVARSFEENYFLPVDHQTQATIEAIDRLSAVFARMRGECE